MSFAGDLSTFDLFDLLAWVHGRRRSGTLVMTRLSTKKRLAFRDGALQRSSSNDPRETIGQALVRERLIKEEALFTALLKQETDPRRLGEILVGDGLLTEPQLMKTLANACCSSGSAELFASSLSFALAKPARRMRAAASWCSRNSSACAQ